MEDADGDRRHGQTVAHASEVPVARVRAYIGLGSNVGDADATLAGAVRALGALPSTRVAAVSSLYATAPVGVTDQPEFRNAVVALQLTTPGGEAGAIALLVALKGLERAFGRRERERWGPRELDLDLLVFGRWAGSVERPIAGASLDPAKVGLALTVPHPEARLRSFVLTPLAEIAPRLVPPGWGETVATAAARQRRIEGPNAVRPIAVWFGDGWHPLGGGPETQPR
jgi:2-amino-4-hydroxy-6-hydroxymethyldihydropteridine diphosphokinase